MRGSVQGPTGRHRKECRSLAAHSTLCLQGHLPATLRGEDAQRVEALHQPPFPPQVLLASGPDGIEANTEEIDKSFLGGMESKETVFLPFPCTLGVGLNYFSDLIHCC